MNCSNCEQANPPHAIYCIYCGEQFEGAIFVVCATCGTHLPEESDYCLQCGTELSDAVAPPEIINEEPENIVLDAIEPQFSIDQYLPANPPRETGLLVGISGSLVQYLPETLYRPLERIPSRGRLMSARDHMISLLRVVKTYLPHSLVLSPNPNGEVSGQSSEGAFLFVDIKGFTALYERLLQQDDEGAERMTGIINDMFEGLITQLFKHKGILLRFGGDALLGFFQTEGKIDLAKSTLLAAHAALAMQKVMEKFSAIDIGEDETVALKLKAGIAAGPTFTAHTGWRGNRVYVVMGHTANLAEQAEGEAEPGEVVLDPTAADLLKGQVESRKKPGIPYYRLSACTEKVKTVRLSGRIIAEDEEPSGSLTEQIAYLSQRLDTLTAYLPENMLPRLIGTPDDPSISPDYRPVSVMFVNFDGFGKLIEKGGEKHPEVVADYLQSYIAQVARIVEDYDGSLARIDQYAVGDRLIIFFGAPNAHEDDPLRAVYAAIEIQDWAETHFAKLKTPVGILKLRQRIGINTGNLLAGNVGAPSLRQEYTLMGDDINMAARLMTSAKWGDILISDRTEEHVADHVGLDDIGEHKVKGKDIPVHMYRVLSLHDQPIEAKDKKKRHLLMGRDEEFEHFNEIMSQLIAGRGQIITVTGDIGIGKSELLRGFRKVADQEYDVRWLNFSARDYRREADLWLIKQILYRIAGVAVSVDGNKAYSALWKAGENLLAEDLIGKVIPYLAYLIEPDMRGTWGEWITTLSSGVLRRQTAWALQTFLAALAEEKPTVIAIDNLQWADDASIKLIQSLLRLTDSSALMFCFSFRKSYEDSVRRLYNHINSNYPHRYWEIDLPSLSEESSIELLHVLTPGADFNTRIITQILERSRGNPLYMREVIQLLIDNELIGHGEGAGGQWVVAEGITEIPLPASLQTTLTTRLDGFSALARSAIQIASVIGVEFSVNMVQALLEQDVENDSWLADLEREGIIQPTKTDDDSFEQYEFLDGLIQPVAYQSLLVQERKDLHRRVAEHFEGDAKTDVVLLAHHFGRSDDLKKAVYYLTESGKIALKEGNPEAACYHYLTLLNLLDKDDTKTREEILDLLRTARDAVGTSELMKRVAETLEE